MITLFRKAGAFLSNKCKAIAGAGDRAWSRLVHAVRRFRFVARRGGFRRAVRFTVYHLRRAVVSHREGLQRGLMRLVPMAAAVALLVVSVHYWTTFTLAYEVNLNGNNVGFVTSEAVFEDACNLLSDRMVDAVYAAPEDVEYNLTLISADAVNNADEVCANIVDATDTIQPAVGLYADSRLVAVCADETTLQQALDGVVAQYTVDGENQTVSFANDIQFIRGLYPAYKVQTSPDPDRLAAALTVQLTVRETYKQPIAYETKEQYDSTRYKGYKGVVTKGENGIEQVKALVTYVNGLETDRQIESITVLKQPVTQVVAIGTKQYTRSSAADNGETLLWPVVGADASNISSVYGDNRGDHMHKGTDILSPRYTPIVASEDGVVIEVGGGSGYGNYCIIQHEGKLSTLYSHCDSVAVTEGQRVKRGEYIACVGDTGRASAYHCHFEVRVNGEAVDGRPYLGVSVN